MIQNNPDSSGLSVIFVKSNCTPERIRTPNPLVRSQVLYPIKPRAHNDKNAIVNIQKYLKNDF